MRQIGGVSVIHNAIVHEKLQGSFISQRLMGYFITAPTMQTSSDKYAWLNHVQCVGKVVEVKLGENSFVKYDVYIVR